MNAKLRIGIVLFTTLLSLTAVSALAQTSGSKTGTVRAVPTPTPQDAAIDADKLPVSFSDFEYEYPGAKPIPFKLRSGNFILKNAKTKETTALNFRKSFFFDVTGDSKTEAVVHILGSTCEMCDDKSLFYVFTSAGLKPVEVFRVLGGVGAQCGINRIVFDVKIITVDAFGDCEVVGGAIVPVKGSALKNKYTQFNYKLTDGLFKLELRDLMDLGEPVTEYRTQIAFGKQ